MSCISKPSRKLLESLANAALNDGFSASDSSSDSEFSSSGSSSSSKSSDQVLTISKPCNEDDCSSSGEDQPSQKQHKGLGGTVSRVKKMRGLGKKKTAGESITYNLSMFSTVQMAKPKKKCDNPKSDFFRLDEDKEWDTMKAQVMAKIDSLLKPTTISYDDYDITFAIPCYSPQPMVLDTKEKYAYLVEHALKAKTPSVKIIIKAKVSQMRKKLDGKGKENIIDIHDSKESDSETEKKWKKQGKHSKIPNVKQLLPGNKAMNDQIGLLRERWRCPTPSRKCGSEHCFIQLDNVDHLVLGFHELESWVAAIMHLF
ncbi:hypothetical protein L208DRAFT_1230276 [Tricholoma matsutake]|nr:hypothetical protein L208DRAFT_1230276 [Tricholoma matsutake 945]